MSSLWPRTAADFAFSQDCEESPAAFLSRERGFSGSEAGLAADSSARTKPVDEVRAWCALVQVKCAIGLVAPPPVSCFSVVVSQRMSCAPAPARTRPYTPLCLVDLIGVLRG